eukprot:2255537-Prorocentrum_lima.AAC.1
MDCAVAASEAFGRRIGHRTDLSSGPVDARGLEEDTAARGTARRPCRTEDLRPRGAFSGVQREVRAAEGDVRYGARRRAHHGE